MSCPKVIPRRPLDDDNPSGYLESDRDFVLNNIDACVWFLESTVKLPVEAQSLIDVKCVKCEKTIENCECDEGFLLDRDSLN